MSRKAYMVGTGIGSLTAAFFLIRDGKMEGKDIIMFEDLKVAGGSLDGCGDAETGYIARGGRMINEPTFECLQSMMKDIPSLADKNKTMYQELMEFFETHKTHATGRLINKHGQKQDVTCMGFSQRDRMELLAISYASEEKLQGTRIMDWFSPEFFETNFWYLWQTLFAFQKWSSAIEFTRYVHRFMHGFDQIDTLDFIMKTPLNQYESIILPIQKWLEERGVKPKFGCRVVDIEVVKKQEQYVATKIIYVENGKQQAIDMKEDDIVIMQNGCMTDASSIGDWNKPAELKTLKDAPSFQLWQKLAHRFPGVFGNPEAFCNNINESMWQSFTLTLDTDVFEKFCQFQGSPPGPGLLTTFRDSNWLMSFSILFQPHFRNQPKDKWVIWGYGLYPNKVGDYVPKRMLDCTGEEIFQELCAHMRLPTENMKNVKCKPCIMPFIDSQFQNRMISDRPTPVPKGVKNIGFVSQFVELPGDVVFTVEYSVRAAQTAVYQLLDIKKKVPKINRYDNKPSTMIKAVCKSYKGKQPVPARRGKKCGACKFLLLGAVAAGIAYAIHKW